MSYREYKLPSCREIVERIYDTCLQYKTHTGYNPSALILGYGTYLAYAQYLTSIQFPNLTTPLIEPKDFNGIPITIDPGHEFRIIALHSGSLMNQALISMSINDNNLINEDR